MVGDLERIDLERDFAADLAALRSRTWAELEAVTAEVRRTGAISDGPLAALGYELAALLVKLDNLLVLLETRRRDDA